MKANSSGRNDKDSLWEESILLIDAETEDEAAARAVAIAKATETQYVSATGDSVVWTFQQVERVFEIESNLRSGTELFSRHLRNSEVQSLLTPFED
jgi:hypothetical protein